MASTPTLQAQLQQMTQQQIYQLLLAYYQSAGYPTTAWQQGGTDIARNQAFATALEDVLATYVPAIAGGNLLDYAPTYPGWTGLTAQQIYGIPGGNNLATFTQGNMVAVNASSTGYSFSPTSPLIATFGASGKRYFSQGTGTIPASSSSAPILFQAEFAGASYVDPSNSAGIQLSTQLPGVTLTNPSTNFSPVARTGSGTGTITPSGSPVGAHTLQVVIASTGQAGVAAISYSLDGGQPVNAGAVASLTNIGGTGINITLANGATNPSFVYQDTYKFSTPSPWITSQGSDAETDPALALRCKNKWPTVSNVPTQGLYQYLLTSNPTVGSQVTQCIVIPDPYVNNKVNLVVAGPGGVLPPLTISTLQSWVTPRARGTDRPVVLSPTTLGITYAATIFCAAAQVSAALAAATTVLQLYTALAPINGTLKLSAIESLIVPNPNTGQGGIVGVTDIQGVTINGLAQNLPLGGVGSYVLPAYPPTINLTFIGQ